MSIVCPNKTSSSNNKRNRSISDCSYSPSPQPKKQFLSPQEERENPGEQDSIDYDASCSDTSIVVTTPPTSPDAPPVSPTLVLPSSQSSSNDDDDDDEESVARSLQVEKKAELYRGTAGERYFPKPHIDLTPHQLKCAKDMIFLGVDHVCILFVREYEHPVLQEARQSLIFTMETYMDIWIAFYSHLVLQCVVHSPKEFETMPSTVFVAESLCYFMHMNFGFDYSSRGIETVVDYIRHVFYSGSITPQFQSVFIGMVFKLPVPADISLMYLYQLDHQWQRDLSVFVQKKRNPTEEQKQEIEYEIQQFKEYIHTQQVEGEDTLPSTELSLMDHVRHVMFLMDHWNHCVCVVSKTLSDKPNETTYGPCVTPKIARTGFRDMFADFKREKLSKVFAFRAVTENGQNFLTYFICAKRIEWFMERSAITTTLPNHQQTTTTTTYYNTLLDLICWLCVTASQYDANNTIPLPRVQQQTCSSTIALLDALQQQLAL